MSDTQPQIFVLNGPNLNMLGKREPEIYGSTTLPDLKALCEREGAALGLGIDFRQTNHEGELIAWIQEARDGAAGIVLNAGALTHTSIGVYDALLAAETPTIEVHLSNVYAREDFRSKSYISPAAVGVLCGFGADGYVFALKALSDRLESR
ncbi:MAG: type II 3-dehydroquinate dehydratase [Pseudomonadota bacterium]